MTRGFLSAGMLLALMSLTACGAGSAPTAAPSPDATNPPALEQATNPPPAPTNAPAVDQGSFSFTVTGDHETTVNNGTLRHRRSEDVFSQSDGGYGLVRSVFMDSWAGSAYPRYGVALTIAREVEAGTFGLGAGGSLAHSMEYSRHESIEDVPIYYQDVSTGTLTITQVEGIFITGSYEFTAAGRIFDAETNTSTTQTVMVMGTFENISVEASE